MQEYTLIKMEALELPGKLTALAQHGKVFFMAATLRPETMYGQTNCWVLPEGDYGAFQGPDKQVYVMCAPPRDDIETSSMIRHPNQMNVMYASSISVMYPNQISFMFSPWISCRRAAWNLCHQDKMPVTGELNCLGEFKGQDLIGTPLKAPRCLHERIYVLPLLTILMSKGTGIVTSVPSDSPTDFMALQDLKKKEKLREKFRVADEWVLPFEVVPIIAIPGFGNTAAVKVCEDLKIQSQNDEKKLEEAKGMVYLKGFTDGVMTVGMYAGEKVSAAKPLIRQELLDACEAVSYAEPESRVMSRSGDECVVALTDQWYLIYGETKWREVTERCLNSMRSYDDTVLSGFKHTLGWLNQWACSRSFGLGTKLPWDPEYVIESLSDSTIYMAYYTVAHILQQGDMYGDAPGGLRPEQLTMEVWDAIFLGKALPEGHPFPSDALARLRDEFNFWYPFDLRVSGKDLIQNHLTFCLYNHTAIFPPEKWPRAMRTNGHLMLNSEKMSKHTGNFMTLRQAIAEYSADAVRIALADASDSNDDGNFESSIANAAILRLTKELAWMEETLAEIDAGSLRTGPELNLADRVVANAVSCAAAAAHSAYEGMMLREALKSGLYDLHIARDAYRVQLGSDAMHADVVRTYIDASVRLLAPIAPHWADHVFRNVLKSGETVLTAGWPQLPPADLRLKMAGEYVEKLIAKLRAALDKKEAPPRADAPAPTKVKGIRLYISKRFAGWRAEALAALAAHFTPASNLFADTAAAAATAAAGSHAELLDKSDKMVKAAAMPFIKFKMAEALELQLPFDESDILSQYLPHIQRSLGLQDISVHSAEGGEVPEGIIDKDGPLPAEPKAVLVT